MRTIIKKNGSPHLSRLHAKPPKTAKEAINSWRNFRHKQEVLLCLLDEQYHVCCYSEFPIGEGSELGCHIEHIENKSQNPARTFDYHNLGASALDSDRDLSQFKGSQIEIFGGHATGKQGRVDYSRSISYL